MAQCMPILPDNQALANDNVLGLQWAALDFVIKMYLKGFAGMNQNFKETKVVEGRCKWKCVTEGDVQITISDNSIEH
ncbi:hypothetical protein HPP92_028925 [Vanilla planifolia]|uniref:Uncharacterized protein n=1 Tax=Vanilla planifolia TaxID=51239 RepID=A0A835P3L8_VANPL|nr:hypothetical protein HPP92_028915 [Vanilla planifolia]KAG0446278.1 hypothetical protein HPP92_028925 [Vanilla planifolia]